MKLKLEIEIEIGNSMMKTGKDLSGALVRVANQLIKRRSPKGAGGKIFDINGNSVGQWQVIEEEENTRSTPDDFTALVMTAEGGELKSLHRFSREEVLKAVRSMSFNGWRDIDHGTYTIVVPSFRQRALRWFVGPEITVYPHYLLHRTKTCPACEPSNSKEKVH